MPWSKSRFATISDISKDIAQVFFASIMIDPLISRATNWALISSGLALSVIFWILAIGLVKE